MYNRFLIDILPNISLLQTLELAGSFWTFISKNLRPPLIFLDPSLSWEFEKMTSFSQKISQVEIIITMWKIAWIYKPIKFLLFLMRIAVSFNCYYYFNSWYSWENDIIFSNSQPRLGTRKINGGRRLLEIKVQKTWVLMLPWMPEVFSFASGEERQSE